MELRGNMKTFSKILIIAIFTVHAVLFQNCNKVKFSATDQSSAVIRTDTGGPNCRSVLENIQTDVKIIYVVDVSGSNDDTDPNQVIRAGSISRFYNSYATRPNFKWNAISFADSSAKVRLAEGDGQKFSDFLAWFEGNKDDGLTPYVAALDETTTLINADPTPTALGKFVVVFLSDGKPDPAVEDDVLKSEISELIATLPGKVSFNTVYYGPENSDASDRLKMMATAGGGNFLDTNKNSSGSLFSISDLVVVPGEVCE
jgi:Mg-chelatase subunit ChlD